MTLDTTLEGRMNGHERTAAQLVSVVGVGVDGELSRPAGLSGPYYAKMRRMRRDPTIKLARWFCAAPILGGSWSYEQRDDAPAGARDLVQEVMDDLRTDLLRTSIYGWTDYGWQPYERLYGLHRDGSLRLRLKPLLQDLTTILVLESTGEYAGLRQDPVYSTGYGQRFVDLTVEESLVVYLDEEGTNWYGEPVMKALESVFDEDAEIISSAKKYMRRIAGSHWVIYYPMGVSKWGGQDNIDNGVVARSLLQSIESVGGLAIPRSMIESLDSLNAQAAAGIEALCWKVELLSDAGAGQTPMNERSAYLDKLKVRAFGFPERALLEGQFGTKAEAEAHADLAISCMEMRHRLFTQQYDRGVVDDLLTKNYGPDAQGSVWIEPAPLADTGLEFVKKVYETWLASPVGFPTETAAVDWLAVRERVGLPLVDPAQMAQLPVDPWVQDMQLMDVAAQPFPADQAEQQYEQALSMAWDDSDIALAGTLTPQTQPRAPKGVPTGGQWIAATGGLPAGWTTRRQTLSSGRQVPSWRSPSGREFRSLVAAQRSLLPAETVATLPEGSRRAVARALRNQQRLNPVADAAAVEARARRLPPLREDVSPRLQPLTPTGPPVEVSLALPQTPEAIAARAENARRAATMRATYTGTPSRAAQQAERVAQRMGFASTLEAVAACGFPEGSHASVHAYENAGVQTENSEQLRISIQATHPEAGSWNASRTLYRNGSTRTGSNNSFTAENKGTGLGTEMIYNESQGLYSHGFKRIEVSAAQGDGYTGGKVWPRLGFDVNVRSLNSTIESYGKTHNLTRLSDFMKTKEHQDWWDAHAVGFTGKFDLTPGSVSHTIVGEAHARLLAKRAVRARARNSPQVVEARTRLQSKETALVEARRRVTTKENRVTIAREAKNAVKRRAEAKATTAMAWDESLHPREEKGNSDGGQFVDKDEANAHYTSKAKKWAKSLTKAERQAIADYKIGWFDNRANGLDASELNSALTQKASRDKKLTSAENAQVKTLDGLIAKATLSEDVVVYHGSAERIKHYYGNGGSVKVGAEIHWPGYMSTSTELSVASAGGRQNGDVLRIKLLKGDRAAYLDAVTADQANEYLLPRDQKLHVTKITKVGKQRLLDVERVQ